MKNLGYRPHSHREYVHVVASFPKLVNNFAIERSMLSISTRTSIADNMIVLCMVVRGGDYGFTRQGS
jgi:hypothetical protein